MKTNKVLLTTMLLPTLLYAGAIQDLYQATYDMRDQFIATTTKLQADAAYLAAQLSQDAVNLSVQLSAQAVNLKNDLLTDLMVLTGTLQDVSVDPTTLNTKDAIDAAELSMFQLLKTIVYKLSLMAPS